MSNEQSCLNCKYVFAGKCRRYPPQMSLWPTDSQHPVMYSAYASFPFVALDEWCGEWTQKTEPRTQQRMADYND